MNVNTLAAIALDDFITTITARFQDGKQDYTFKCPRYLAKDLKKGDLILVETQWQGIIKISIAVVVDVHEHALLDPEKEIEYRYAFSKISVDTLNSLKRKEESIAKRLDQIRRDNWKQQVFNKLGLDLQTVSRTVLEDVSK